MVHEKVLAGKNAFVTGASGGLGLSIAAALAEAGATLFLTDVDDKLLDGAAKKLAELEHPVAGTYVSDLSQPEDVRALAGRVADDASSIDVVVNNAGIRHIVPFLDLDLDRWQSTIAVNLTAPFLLAQYFARDMAARGSGSIINIASVAGASAFNHRVAYNSTKAALIMLTRSIAFELGSQGVRCNAIAPGVIETPLTTDYFKDSQVAAKINEFTPMARPGKPDEIANPVVFLASDAASYINGTTLFVDGGWMTGKSF